MSQKYLFSLFKIKTENLLNNFIINIVLFRHMEFIYIRKIADAFSSNRYKHFNTYLNWRSLVKRKTCSDYVMKTLRVAIEVTIKDTLVHWCLCGKVLPYYWKTCILWSMHLTTHSSFWFLVIMNKCASP